MEDEYVINQGEEAKEMFIIFKGEVLILQQETMSKSERAR